MLAYIRSNYKAGDSIEVTTSEGVFTGLIEYVSNKYIVLRLPNGQVCGIADTDIRTFRADRPDNPVIPQDPVAQPAIDAAASAALEEAGEAVVTTRDIENAEAADALTGPENSLSEPKVIGKIDLDSLKRIDPKFSRRTYFKPAGQGEQEGAGAEEAATGSHQDASPSDYTRGGYIRKPFVQAKGRITYYNPDKRFGFIHDYQSDNDLYFSQQQVADFDLYDHLQKGTKVAYSVSRNQQGLVALCVHLPHTVEDLLTIAEDYFNARHYFLAKGLAEHALEVVPDDKEALSLLDEIQNATAAARQSNASSIYKRDSGSNPALYSACPTYAEAKKAYLDKDYERAVTLYLSALEKEEKVESCIKDLVTLYVSQFKQAQTDAERREAHARAADFLDSHRELLPDNLTTKQFLALNYYLPMQEYEKFIEAVDELMNNPQVAESMSRRIFYIWQKGIALNKLGRSEEALALVDEGLQLAPYSRQLQNLRNAILHPEEYQGESPSEASAASAATEEAVSPTAAAPSAEGAGTETSPETGRPQSDAWWESLKHPMA